MRNTEVGVPGTIRTCNRQIRSLELYPVELRVQYLIRAFPPADPVPLLQKQNQDSLQSAH